MTFRHDQNNDENVEESLQPFRQVFISQDKNQFIKKGHILFPCDI
jgi:hypothetical protein